MPFEVNTTRGNGDRLDGAELGNADLKIGKQLEQEGFEFLVGAVHLVDEQDRRFFAADGGQQRPLEQIPLRENMFLDRIGIFADAFAGFYGEQLALIIPFVKRGVLVETLVALQANKLGAVHGGQRLADLGLADAGLAFKQQRTLEELHQPQRGRNIAVGDVANGREPVGNFFALEGHSAQPFSSSCAGLTRASIFLPLKMDCRVEPGNDESRADARTCHPCRPSFSAAVQVRQ